MKTTFSLAVVFASLAATLLPASDRPAVTLPRATSGFAKEMDEGSR